MIKGIVLIFILIFSVPRTVYASNYIIEEINFNCSSKGGCKDIEDKFEFLENLETNTEELKNELKLTLLDKSIKEFSYTLVINNSKAKITLNITPNPIIQEINFDTISEIDPQELSKYLVLKEGRYFSYDDYLKSEDNLKKFLEDTGFRGVHISLDQRISENEVDLKIKIKIDEIIKVQRVEVLNEKDEIDFDLEKRFFNLYGEILDELKFKLIVDQIQQELFNEGYFLSSVEILPKKHFKQGSRIIHVVRVKKGQRFNFSFYGNKKLARVELLNVLKTEIKKSLSLISSGEMIKALLDSYENRGIYSTKISMREVSGVTKTNETYQTVFFYIKEGSKIPVREIEFKGQEFFNQKQIEQIYYENATVLASRGYLDKKYLDEFKKILRIKYLEQGYIFIDISDPKINFIDNGREAEIFFKIRENNKTHVGGVIIKNVPDYVREKIIPKLTNKPGAVFNVVNVDQDINTIEALIREEGYYFSKIRNTNKRDIIRYSPDYTSAYIELDILLGKKSILKNSIITGNIKTKQKVILREIQINKGDTVTPDKISAIRDRLSSLNLFSYINITPFITNEGDNSENHDINLLINVREKDSISLIIAPGYRTDLGVKLSTELHFNNLNGMDRELSIVARANQRLNFSHLDQRRRNEEKRLIEFSLRTSFLEPYLLGKKLEFETSLRGNRRRFRGFDADIVGYSASISKRFFDFLTTSLEYQLEVINQFDATEEKDKGDFRIGSITPSLGLDFRNNKVNPTHGAFFTLSWEFANPYFFSQEKEDLTINFNRLVSRNRFYYSVSKEWSLGPSISIGAEKNFARTIKNDGSNETIGFIPSIKVFRLDGIDTIRGFRDDEINKVEGGEDIADLRIDDIAYFSVIKFEPRYLIDDSMMAALFFDAGRVFVNHFSPIDLRSSTGLSFKLLTPVGSLDFDYGVKFRRKKDNLDRRETFGRFHLSIGFF